MHSSVCHIHSGAAHTVNSGEVDYSFCYEC